MVIVFLSSATDFAPVTVEVFNNLETTDRPADMSTFSIAVVGITI